MVLFDAIPAFVCNIVVPEPEIFLEISPDIRNEPLLTIELVKSVISDVS